MTTFSSLVTVLLLATTSTLAENVRKDERKLVSDRSNLKFLSHDNFEQAYAKIKTETGVSFMGDTLNTYNQKTTTEQHESALVEVGTKVGGAMNNCENCVYVLERIKQGYQYLLPSICVEIYSKENKEQPYGVCHEVLASLSVWGNNVRHWLHYGCYKAESYGAMELIRPCPSHIICSQMADFKKKAFCDKQKQEELKAGKR